MIGEYSCPFLCNTRKACGNPCIRPEGCRFHWKAKKRIPCSDCGKPTSSACGQCPLHVRGYYVTQYYNRLRSESLQSEMQERLRLVIQEIQERLRSETRERTYEEIMVAHRDKLAILNIILCRECLLPIKMEKGKYCDNCRPE
jgi:predicted amidophosphoribosyltransferase